MRNASVSNRCVGLDNSIFKPGFVSSCCLVMLLRLDIKTRKTSRKYLRSTTQNAIIHNYFRGRGDNTDIICMSSFNTRSHPKRTTNKIDVYACGNIQPIGGRESRISIKSSAYYFNVV